MQIDLICWTKTMEWRTNSVLLFVSEGYFLLCLDERIIKSNMLEKRVSGQ